MLPSSRRSAAAAACALLILFGSSVSLDAFGHDTMVLVSGPVRRRGLELLPPNPLEHFVARYQYADQEIEISYLSMPLSQSGQWQPVGCSIVELSRVTSGENPVYYLADPAGGFALLISAGQSDPCRVAERFMQEFSFFRTVSYGEPTHSFPAVITLP